MKKKKAAASRAYEKAKEITAKTEQMTLEQEKQKKIREEEVELDREIAAQMALLKAEQLRSLAAKNS